MASEFISLHNHSHYSLLSALPKLPDMIARAKELQMPALALTDLGNLYGAIEFYKTCEKEGIKSILGVHVFVTLEENESQKRNEEEAHSLVLLAENNVGYQNLVRLVTDSYMRGFEETPYVTLAELKKYSDGLIALSGGTNSQISMLLEKEKASEAEEVAHVFQDVFGEKNFYLELVPRRMNIVEGFVTISKQLNIPLVAAKESFYLDPEDKMAHNALLSVQQSNVDRRSGEDLSFLTPKDAAKVFSEYPEALANTKVIADRCNVKLELGNWVFPDIKIDENENYDQALRRRAYEGLDERGLPHSDEVITRVDYELSVIKTKGYSPYFLVVSDLLTFAKEAGIFATTRGSAGGSLVAYLTGITTIDPLEYKLPFERFLNPERPSAPDVDMDLADDRRDEMIQYAQRKYGMDKVAQIGTFGTMAARGAVRDIARALGYPYSIGDKIAKLIPFGSQGFPMTIDRALEEEPDLKELYEMEDDVQEIIDMAKKVEGCARHISIHAAGVVIAPTTITDFVPLQHDPKGGKMITQYDMHAVEDAGLLKFDFLGIRNLAIISDALKLIKELEGIEIEIENIPLDDKKTFDLLARGETIGLFQLGGSGMTRYLMELKPTTVHDINAMVALYRPGPMEFIPEYIARKNNPDLVEYPHKDLEHDLELSYGLLVYQDDVMITAIKLADYTWLEADMFRKAMGKKIPALMAEQKQKFIKGCRKNDIPEATIKSLWSHIEPFAAYGFNKAHAASYGRVAYQTAYLKANYPVAYMTAVLSSVPGDTDRIAEIVAELKHMEIPILPPSVNDSFGDFSVTSGEKKNDSIRFGLYTIKNLGEAISDAIIAERDENGKYTSFSDFLVRNNHKDLNRKSLDALIKSGALDELGTRGSLLASVDSALSFKKEHLATLKTDQTSLFANIGESAFSHFELADAEEVSMDDRLSWEKELLGLYITGHPLDKFEAKLKKNRASINRVKENGREKSDVIVAGIIEEVKKVMTKKGDPMAFLKLADKEDSIELVMFPKTYLKYKDNLTPNLCVAVKGKFSKRNGEASVLADRVKRLTVDE